MSNLYDKNFLLQIKYIVMINCGGTLDLVELLEPDDSVVFFILDSHRPYDLCNIYSENQVCILGKPDEDNEIPEYNDIFRDDSVCNICNMPSCFIISFIILYNYV